MEGNNVKDFNPFRSHIRALRPKITNRTDWANGLRLDRAEVPFPPSPAVIEALQLWPKAANRYPDPECGELRAALEVYTGHKASQIVVGNGSDDIIDTIVRCCLDRNDEVLIPIPTFYFYQRSAETAGGRAVWAPMTNQLELDINAVLSHITPRTKAIFIANPNNPTGKLTPPAEILKIVEDAPCLVAVDECYFEFGGETISEAVDRYSNLIIIRSFSKAFGLASARLGYAIGNENMIQSLHSVMQPFPVSGSAQLAGIAALGDLPYMRKQIRILRSEIEWLSVELRSLGVLPYQSSTNFVLVDLGPRGVSASRIASLLRKRAVYVWDCTGFPGTGDNHIRITSGNNSQNAELVDHLGSVLSLSRTGDQKD